MKDLESKLDERHESGKVERDTYRTKIDGLITAMQGDEYGNDGYIKDSKKRHEDVTERLDIIKTRQESDYKLLLPNRALASFWTLVKRPVAWLVALAVLAVIFGVDVFDYLKHHLGMVH